MKISLALGPRVPLSRQTAWGCFTTNLAVPGFGSLMAGRRSGYAQVVLGIGGMALTTVFGLRFLVWYAANWSRLQSSSQVDPFTGISEIWGAVKWALVGFGVFGLGWVWGLGTGLAIIAEAKKGEGDGRSTGAPDVPPVLD